MNLLQDVFIIENLSVLNESKNGNTIVEGIFGRANEENRNGRIYPGEVLKEQIKKLQPTIEARRLCGELDHPQNDTVKLSNASHIVTMLEMRGNDLFGRAEILNTPAGQVVKALIDGGVQVGISSRGMGTLSEGADGKRYVNEDFKLVTFDLVADPSTRGAFPTLAESTESAFVRENLSKLEKEGNFVTMLEGALRNAFSNHLEEGKKSKKRKKSKKSKRALDPVGQEDSDIDNDGMPNTKKDKFLKARRNRIGAAMKRRRRK